MTSFCKTIYDEEKKLWSGPPEDYDLSRPVGEVMLGHLRRRGDKVMQVRFKMHRKNPFQSWNPYKHVF